MTTLESEPMAPPVPLEPREQARLITERVMESWVRAHEITADVSECTRQLAGRALTWISPVSVRTGVGDVLSTVKHETDRLPPEWVDQLAVDLARGLQEANLLAIQARRSGLSPS